MPDNSLEGPFTSRRQNQYHFSDSRGERVGNSVVGTWPDQQESPMEMAKCYGTFTNAIRPTLLASRIFGLSPLITTRSPDGTYQIRLSLTAKCYTYIITPLLLIVSILTTLWLKSENQQIGAPVWYVSSRHCLSALLAFSCLHSAHLMMASLQNIENLGVKVPVNRIWLLGPVILVLILHAVGLMWTMPVLEPFTSYLLGAIAVLPVIKLIVICSQFGWQVAVLNLALSDLYENASRLENTTHFKDASLRPIMRRQHALKCICTGLNRAYGKVLVFVTTSEFFEVIGCTVLSAKHLSKIGVLSGISWSMFSTIPLLTVILICQKTQSKFLQNENLAIKIKVQQALPQSEIYEWEMQLKHQQLRFTACGLFYLDGALIMTIICAVTSYTAVFLQLNF